MNKDDFFVKHIAEMPQFQNSDIKSVYLYLQLHEPILNQSLGVAFRSNPALGEQGKAFSLATIASKINNKQSFPPAALKTVQELLETIHLGYFSDMNSHNPIAKVTGSQLLEVINAKNLSTQLQFRIARPLGFLATHPDLLNHTSKVYEINEQSDLKETEGSKVISKASKDLVGALNFYKEHVESIKNSSMPWVKKMGQNIEQQLNKIETDVVYKDVIDFAKQNVLKDEQILLSIKQSKIKKTGLN